MKNKCFVFLSVILLIILGIILGGIYLGNSLVEKKEQVVASDTVEAKLATKESVEKAISDELKNFRYAELFSNDTIFKLANFDSDGTGKSVKERIKKSEEFNNLIKKLASDKNSQAYKMTLGDQRFSQAVKAFIASDNNLTKTYNLYNENAKNLNNFIDTFPGSVIAKLLKVDKVKVY